MLDQRGANREQGKEKLEAETHEEGKIQGWESKAKSKIEREETVWLWGSDGLSKGKLRINFEGGIHKVSLMNLLLSDGEHEGV